MAIPRTGYMGTDEPEAGYGPARSAGQPPRSAGQQGSEDTRPIPSEVAPPEGMGYEDTGDMVMDRAGEAGIDPTDPGFIARLRERYLDDPELQQALDYIEGLGASEAGADPALLGGNSPLPPPM